MQTTLTEPTQSLGKYGFVDNYIGGKFVRAGSGRTLAVYSPLDGSLLGQMPCSTAADLDAAILALTRIRIAQARKDAEQR